MRNSIIKFSSLTPFLIITFLLTEISFAQKIKVKRTKGRNAVIESSVPLEEGEVYDLQTATISESPSFQNKGLKSRQNSLLLGGSFVSQRGTDYQKNAGALHARYGWNFIQLEFGAAVDITSVDLGAGPTTDFLLGGYFDYNLVSNRDPNPFVYGPFAFAGFGSIQSPSSRGGGSTSIFSLNGGGFLTWYLAGTSTALRGEVYLDIQQINTSTRQTDVMGFGSRGFLVFYF